MYKQQTKKYKLNRQKQIQTYCKDNRSQSTKNDLKKRKKGTEKNIYAFPLGS